MTLETTGTLEQGRRKQLRIGGADPVALRALASKKFLLINIHEEGVFHAFTRLKMAIRLVFAAVHSVFAVSSKMLQLYLYCSLGCSVVSPYTRNLGGAVLPHRYLWGSNCSPCSAAPVEERSSVAGAVTNNWSCHKQCCNDNVQLHVVFSQFLH